MRKRRRVGSAVLVAGAGYLIGTIPWADLAAHRATAGQVDLRASGSGNPGTLNAIQHLGKGWGVAVGLADVGKGVAASFLGRAIGGDIGAHIGGTAAVVGHCYPVWSGFRGGKGVATASGQCIANHPAAVPLELAAAAVGILGPFEERSHKTAALMATTWGLSATLWWRRGWPNAWAPQATFALPLAAAASGAIVMRRFSQERTAGRSD